MKFVYVKNADNDEALLPIDKVTLIEVNDADVVVYGNLGNFRQVTITLSVTDGKESIVAKALAEAIAGSSSNVITLGDDVASSYFHPDVTAVESLTIDVTQAS
tara:strand:- start:592 stop:900 length:309 start_codon:yes stop_codon:yes gene_type:complete